MNTTTGIHPTITSLMRALVAALRAEGLPDPLDQSLWEVWADLRRLAGGPMSHEVAK